MSSLKKSFFLPKLNIFLYSILLIVTPFLFLKNYLQDAIGQFSRWSINIGFVQIPIVFTVFVLAVAILIFYYRKHITALKTTILGIVFLLWGLGQYSSDHYLDAKFYDLQNNWHYLAYGIFAFLVQQFLISKKYSLAKNILITFFLALGISTFDEIVQFFLSNRVFDISDIAKDLWGVIMGMIVFYLIINTKENKISITKIRQKELKDYLNAPFSLLVLLLIFTYILLFISSFLSDVKYAVFVVLISIGLFLLFLFIIHKTYSKKNRIIALAVISILLLTQITSFIINYNKGITYNSYGLIIYKGIPIPYFDFIICENGMIKLVDKKNNFNQTDIKYLYKQASNILIIGSCENENERMGFPELLKSQFVFNHVINEAIQIIILPIDEACKTFNRLKKENKTVAFVIHNTE